MAALELQLQLSGSSVQSPLALVGASTHAETAFDVIPPMPPAAPGDHSSARTNSRVYTVFLLLNSMIGSGVFNIPHVFARAGIVSAYCMLTAAGLLVYFGLTLLVQAAEAAAEAERAKSIAQQQQQAIAPDKEGDDYSRLAERIFGRGFGPAAAISVDASIVVIGLGSLLSYLAAITGTISLLLKSWGSAANPLGLTAVLVACFVFPLCLQRFYGHFAAISVISIVSVSGVLLLVLVGGPLYAQKYEGATPSSQAAALVLGNPVQQLGSVIFTFSCASATFHTFRYMRDKTVNEWRAVAAWTVALGWFLCALMGTGGFLAFGAQTDGIILSNFQRGHIGDFFQVHAFVVYSYF